MDILILAHPRHGSFNHAIAETTIDALKNKGHRVIFHDLYQEKFDAILPMMKSPGMQNSIRR